MKMLFPCISAVLLATVWGIASAGEPATVRMWEQSVAIPTYPLGEADKDPIFYSGRRYQGAKGPVYPYAMLDKLGDRPVDKPYRTVYLENKYLQLSILPELGGRIFTGLDKTNGYDFFYRQHVIKPALIGMAGAWISGGVEWNIPHHHRVTTFMPVDYRLVENPDGSKTVWLGETEWRHRMKWLVGVTLHPDRSYLEITTKLFNRTPVAHSMLCFANVAVHANADYQVIFPPGTEYGTQHAKREFVHWPIGQEVYNRVDRRGVDLSWWKNQPSPISIFAWNYDDDFVGGYDHGKQAGVVHVADHHVAPGKKFFTWGSGEEGRMWDKVLTDGDGPYIELMTGAYSDNQPDYSWVQPYETRIVREIWYPLRSLGGIKNANDEAAVNLELDASHTARLAVNTTSERRAARVVLEARGKTIYEKTAAIGPERPFVAQVAAGPGVKPEDLKLTVWSDGKELVRYQPAKPRGAPMPDPVTPPPAPQDVKTADELHQIGLRLEQFHNAAIEPYPYYQEALKRDPGDSRANTALGILYCKRGMFVEAEQRLRAAIARITTRYTVPKDTEAFYYLGVALDGQGKHDAADEAFYQATWGQAWSAAGYFALAQNACRKGRLAEALDLLHRSLATNTRNHKGLGLKAMLLRRLGRTQEALAAVCEAQRLDPLDFWSGNEAYLVAAAGAQPAEAGKAKAGLEASMRGEVQSYLELASDYAACGVWDDAIDVLTRFVAISPDKTRIHPMVYYNLADFCDRKGSREEARRYGELAAKMPRDYCFPFRLESIDVLRRAMAANPADARALYYLGNLLYDIQPREAIAAWEKSRDLDPGFGTVHRNLGLAYARIEGDYPKAAASLTAAVEADPTDPRPFTELDEVAEVAGVSLEKRLAILEKNAATVARRDDALLRHVGLCLLAGRYDRALTLLADHRFRRWEGENGPHTMYVDAHLLRGQRHLDAKQFAEARQDFLAALEYPENFETGRPLHGGPKTAEIEYLLGVTSEALGKPAEARRHFEQAVAAGAELLPIRYYDALAQRKLGNEAAAQKTLDALVRAGTETLDSLKRGPRTDFFGIFGTNQAPALQAAEAHYLIGLGLQGKGRAAEARAEFERAVKLNPNHLGAKTRVGRGN